MCISREFRSWISTEKKEAFESSWHLCASIDDFPIQRAPRLKTWRTTRVNHPFVTVNGKLKRSTCLASSSTRNHFHQAAARNWLRCRTDCIYCHTGRKATNSSATEFLNEIRINRDSLFLSLFPSLPRSPSLFFSLFLYISCNHVFWFLLPSLYFLSLEFLCTFSLSLLIYLSISIFLSYSFSLSLLSFSLSLPLVFSLLYFSLFRELLFLVLSLFIFTSLFSSFLKRFLSVFSL